MTSEVDSFAQKTILHRKPRIIDEVIAENDYPSFIIKHLVSFKKEILGNNVQLLTEKAHGQIKRIAAEDPEWLINGQRGIIQYVKPTVS